MVLGLIACLFVIIYLSSCSLQTVTEQNKIQQNCNASCPKIHDIEDNKSWGRHKLAVLIPFRDRLEELLEFAPYLHKYLNNQKVRHDFYVLNQIDNHRYLLF